VTQSSTRTRRNRHDIRERLLESALIEFGARGFDGASTRAIARRVDAHQPQINYHFESKGALWAEAVDHLFAQLHDAIDPLFSDGPADRARLAADARSLARRFADGITVFVRFAAAHPELNQIMIHEATTDSDRLAWMTETHVRPVYEALRPLWRTLRDAGIAAPVDDRVLHYILVGGASLPYVLAPEARRLTGLEPFDPAFVDMHARSVVAMLLPNLDGSPA
jgi:TetR/AcrR family transcriptional regulator